MATETAAHGISLKIGDGATSESFNAIQKITNGPNGPNFNCRIIEASSHSDAAIIKKASLRDNGQVTFDLLYDSTDTQHALLMTNHLAKTVTNFQMILTDTGAEQYAFSAIVSTMNFSGQAEGWNTMAVTLEISGDITVT